MAQKNAKRPRDFREYLASIAPLPFTGYWGSRFTGVLGLALDVLMERARRAVVAGFATSVDAPDDALDERGAETRRPRYPGEATAAYRARLAKTWRTWMAAGTALGLQAQLADVGIGATVMNGQDARVPPGGPNSWSRAHVRFDSTPWAPRRYADGSVLGDGSTIGSTATRNEAAVVRRMIRQGVEAHFVVDGLALNELDVGVRNNPLYAWFRPDRYVASSGGVDALVDLTDATHRLNFFGGANAVRSPAPDFSATANNRIALSMNPGASAVTGCGYRSNRTPSSWSFLRLSAGYEVWFVYRVRTLPTLSVLLGTSGAGQLWDYWWNSTALSFRNYSEVVAANVGGSPVSNLLRLTRIIGSANGGATIQHSAEAFSASTVVPGAASALVGDLVGSLALGMQPGSALYPADLEFCDLIVHPQQLSASQATLNWLYMSRRYGIPRWSF